MSERDLEPLAEELRRWATRPSAISPGAARTRVLASLSPPRRRAGWRLAAGGAALAAIVLAVVLTGERRDETPALDRAPASGPSQQIILHQLSTGTPLYIVVPPAALTDGP